MLSVARLLALRSTAFFKRRVAYAGLKHRFDQDWSRYYWSLQVLWPCNFHCSYCIQGFGLARGRQNLAGAKPLEPGGFLKLNRLEARLAKPIERLVIQGGEPTLYAGLATFLDNIRVFRRVTIVSNLSRSLDDYVAVAKRRRDIGIDFVGSFHPEFAALGPFLAAATRLRDEGMLDYCDFIDLDFRESARRLEAFEKAGIPCRPYRFVGERAGRIYPAKAAAACNGKNVRDVDCFTLLVLIAPDGRMYNCHAKMYRGQGHLCTIEEFPEKFPTGYLRCREYGLCQPCQIDEMKVRDLGRSVSPERRTS